MTTVMNHCLELKLPHQLDELRVKWRLKQDSASPAEDLFIRTIDITLQDLKDEPIDKTALDDLIALYHSFDYWTDYNLKSLKATQHLLPTSSTIELAQNILGSIDNI